MHSSNYTYTQPGGNNETEETFSVWSDNDDDDDDNDGTEEIESTASDDNYETEETLSAGSDDNDETEEIESVTASDDNDETEENKSEYDSGQDGDESDIDMENTDMLSGDEDWDYWSEVIQDAISMLSPIPENAKQLMQKPMIDEFLDNIRESLEQKINLTNYMQYTDPIYLEIKRKARKIRKQEPDKGSAFEKAWDERHYFLKRFIRNNLDTIQDRCFDGEESDESEDGEEEDTENRFIVVPKRPIY